MVKGQAVESACLSAVHKAMAGFHKKLLVFQLTEPKHTLAVYLPKRSVQAHSNKHSHTRMQSSPFVPMPLWRKGGAPLVKVSSSFCSAPMLLQVPTCGADARCWGGCCGLRLCPGAEVCVCVLREEFGAWSCLHSNGRLTPKGPVWALRSAAGTLFSLSPRSLSKYL